MEANKYAIVYIGLFLCLSNRTSNNTKPSDYLESANEEGKSILDSDVKESSDFIIDPIEFFQREEEESYRKEKFDPSGLPIDNLLGMQLAFLVNLNGGCTGTLIHPDWIITATHCFDWEYNEAKPDENGDMVFEPKYGMSIDTKISTTGLNESQYWTKPVKYKKCEGKQDCESWAVIDKFVFDKDFVDEARSWKGGDVTLLHLKPGRNTKGTEGVILPMCLPEKTFNMTKQEGRKSYMAGFGRRRLPHCLTDGSGPEKYAVCGRPVACSHNHRARKCGLEFTYQNKTHNHCLKVPTPSQQSKICQAVLKSIKKEDFSEPTYIFKEGRHGRLDLETICYRTRVRKGEKGWCTTRDPMHDQNMEPKADSGWGFCSQDEDQKDCNKRISHMNDMSAYEVEIMKDNWCLDEMFLNLQKEQPKVTFDQIKPFPRLFCVGQRHTKIKEKYYKWTEGDAFELKEDTHKEQIKAAMERSDQVTDPIEGGPACFGDSGGPMWTNYLDSDGVTRPVLVGVYSFMLWGTCRGRHEPAYYGRITDYLQFIQRHIPKQELCTVHINK